MESTENEEFSIFISEREVGSSDSEAVVFNLGDDISLCLFELPLVVVVCGSKFVDQDSGHHVFDTCSGVVEVHDVVPGFLVNGGGDEFGGE